MKKYNVEVYEDRTIWYNEDMQLERLDGKPAIVWNNGDKEYFVQGNRHRDHGPAIVYAFEPGRYFRNGVEYYPKGLMMS